MLGTNKKQVIGSQLALINKIALITISFTFNLFSVFFLRFSSSSSSSLSAEADPCFLD